MLESQENKFREIMMKIRLAGACGWCAMDASIAYVDGDGISKQVKECKRMSTVKCIDAVNSALDDSVPE